MYGDNFMYHIQKHKYMDVYADIMFKLFKI